MRKLFVAVSLLSVLAATLFGAQDGFGGIHLLDGYTAMRKSAVDAAVWNIEGKNGFKIHFEAGPNEGSWASPREIHKYSWYREQILRGCLVRYALVKSGLKTQWEPDDGRALAPGNILLVTFLVTKDKPDHTANFSAKIGSREELADALLMVSSFDPTKGNF